MAQLLPLQSASSRPFVASIFVVAVVAVAVSSAIVLISLAANSFDTQNATAASSVVIS